MLIGGCGYQAPSKAERTRTLLAQCATQDSARDALTQYLFLPEDLPQIYAYLEAEQADDSLAANSSRGQLLLVLETLHAPNTAPFLEDLYPQLSSPHQQLALRTLAQQGNAISSEALVRLLSQEADLSPGSFQRILAPYFDQPANIEYLFPDILSMAEQAGYRQEVMGLLRAGLEQGSIQPVSLRDQLPTLQQYFQLADQEPTTQAQLLYILSFFAEQPAVNQLLTDATSQGTAQTRLAATLAFLDRGIGVEDSSLENLAAEVSIRNELYLALQARGQEDRFPIHWHTQWAFASSDMVSWLSIHSPKARRIEPLEAYILSGSQERLYSFRFVQEGYWRVGFSGPQPADSSQIRVAGYLTGSDFERYHRRRLAAHVRHWLESQGVQAQSLQLVD